MNFAAVPSDSFLDYLHAGRDEKEIFRFDPTGLFDQVYILSPLEFDEREINGVKIIPTKPKDFTKNLIKYKIDLVRAFGGYEPCDLVCKNKIPGIPAIVSVHDTKKELLYNSIRWADYVFCVSNIVADMVKRKRKKDNNVLILPNRVDTKLFFKRDSKDYEDLNKRYPGLFRILHVGRKTEQKNPETLIRALKFLGKEYTAVFLGHGNIEKYKKIAKSECVENQCYFEGAICKKDLSKYYSWCHCLCVPSRWEGFGIVFIESMACESVVVTSDIAPMNEFIKHEENGLLVKKYEDPWNLSQEIRRACKDKGLRDNIKIKAKKSIEQFSKEYIDIKEAKLYKNILELNNSGKLKQNLYPKYFKFWDNIKSIKKEFLKNS